ncbi:MAG TPA: hypothetical protein VMN60_09175 [Longimicrobiales bacterium]|nr:hypothetical protein [Longimicrobiales bacterium]
MSTHAAPLAIYYEHPDWFRPLFQELGRRGVPYDALHADTHAFDPATPPPHTVVFNRLSPSAWLRGRAHAIHYTSEYLHHLERHGVRVLNGTAAWQTEISKARQIALLQALGLPAPRTRVINHGSLAPAAARGFRFPVIVKPNIGGSGAGVTRFDSPAALERAAAAGTIALGIDNVGLVQEYIPQQHGRIVRVEVLDGRFLYAIRIYTTGDNFNLCPADVCQSVAGVALERAACALDAPHNGLRVEAYSPPPDIIAHVERIMQRAGIEIGGVEYFVDDRDGELYYYDINALSNFVADAPRVIGFDPFARLADWIERELANAVAALRQEVA